MEGENSPSDETGGDGDEDDGTEEQGFGDNTESAGGKSLSAWRGKRFGLRWVRTVLMGRRGRLFKSLTWIIIMLSYLSIVYILYSRLEVAYLSKRIPFWSSISAKSKSAGCLQSQTTPSENKIKEILRRNKEVVGL
jgi:hypothetical protein